MLLIAPPLITAVSDAQVDVEVYLCYCTGDGCNKVDIAGAGRPGPGAGHGALVAILTLAASTLRRH